MMQANLEKKLILFCRRSNNRVCSGKLIFSCSALLCMIIGGYSQGEIYQIGNSNNYVAGDFYDKVETYKAIQYSQNWCWAACIQMVLKRQGVFVDQCTIVKRAFGAQDCIDRPADCNKIKSGASDWYVNGRRIVASIDHNYSANSLIHVLANKYPVIIGLNMPRQNIGHAYVLTAIFFSYDQLGRKLPFKVILRDPWPNNPSRLELSWSDFSSRINCVTHVTF